MLEIGISHKLLTGSKGQILQYQGYSNVLCARCRGRLGSNSQPSYKAKSTGHYEIHFTIKYPPQIYPTLPTYFSIV